MDIHLSDAEKFALYVDRSGGVDACWIWTGRLTPQGYGYVSRDSNAHRFAYLVYVGPIPDGLQVNHRCPGRHNRACCNPRHLYVGTQKENLADRLEQGTINSGERNGNSKLTADDVRSIRTRYAAGGVRQIDLAEEYGVRSDNISRIVSGERWKHIP